MKNKLLYLPVFAVLFIIGYKAATYDSSDEVHKRKLIILGTVLEIQVRNEDKKVADKIINEAFEEMKRIDRLFSIYDTRGEVYKINHDSSDNFVAEGDIRTVLELSDTLWRITGGAFDISLQNLTEAWGFSNSPAYPGDEKIGIALENSGWDKVQYKEGIIVKNNCQFNFGAIAKGYAVDRAVEILKQHNINDALVNAGGEIRATGGDWSIGIQDPDNSNKIIYAINLNGMSAATSGDYEQYFMQDGKRYHHILDPLTGYPGDLCRSVTVIAPENYFADALATGIFIMGPEKGISVVESLENTEVMIVDANNKIWSSSGFNNYILR